MKPMGPRGYNSIASALAYIRHRPTTTPKLAKYLGLRYVSTMYLVNDLIEAELIYFTGREIGKGPAREIAYRGGEGKESSALREITARFVVLWNGFLEPDSVGEVAAAACLHRRTVANTVKRMQKLGLIHIDSWQRNPVGEPTALWVLGGGNDAQRPQPYSNTEQCRRWYQSKRQKEMTSALMFVREPEREAA